MLCEQFRSESRLMNSVLHPVELALPAADGLWRLTAVDASRLDENGSINSPSDAWREAEATGHNKLI